MKKHKALAIRKVTLRDLDESTFGWIAGGTETDTPSECGIGYTGCGCPAPTKAINCKHSVTCQPCFATPRN